MSEHPSNPGGNLPPRGGALARIIWILLALLLPTIVLATSRFAMPGDSAVLDLTSRPTEGQGLYIAGFDDPTSPLRPGDRLLAVNGHPIDELLGFSRPADAAGTSGQLIHYRVQRDSQVLELTQSLTRLDPTATIGYNWPSFFFLVYLESVAAFVYARRPQSATARALLLYASLTFGSGLAFFLGLHPIDLLRGWPYWIFVWTSLPLFGLAMAGVLHFLLMFPNRHRILDRHPWIVALVYLSPAALFIPPVASGWTQAGAAGGRLVLAMRTTGLFDLVYPLAGMLLLTHGYLRLFDPRERRQTRWVLWGGAMVAVPWLGLSVVPGLLGHTALLPQFVIGLLWLLLPSALAIAIVRESLFDIDRIINRTLVYASSTVVLVVVYLAAVVALQQLFEALTGQRTPLAIVLSTLVIAALFNPLRSRIQQLIDRRFYRRRYNAARALSELSVEMQHQVDLADLSQSILNLAAHTLQPMHVSLWLRLGEPPG